MYSYLPIRIRRDGSIDQTSDPNAIGAFAPNHTVPAAIYANLPNSTERRIESAVVYTITALGFLSLIMFAGSASILGALAYVALYLAFVSMMFYTVIFDPRPDIGELSDFLTRVPPHIHVSPSLEDFTTNYPRSTYDSRARPRRNPLRR